MEPRCFLIVLVLHFFLQLGGLVHKISNPEVKKLVQEFGACIHLEVSRMMT